MKNLRIIPSFITQCGLPLFCGTMLPFAVVACVPATSYEQATSAIEVEAESHRRTQLKLSASETELRRIQEENERLTASRSNLERELLAEEHRLAQLSLDKETTQKEHEQQVELVTQLRGELARVGEHIKTVITDQDELTLKLAAAEEQVRRLQAEIAELNAKAENSETAQVQLHEALGDLEALQEEVARQAEPLAEGAEPLVEQIDQRELIRTESEDATDAPTRSEGRDVNEKETPDVDDSDETEESRNSEPAAEPENAESTGDSSSYTQPSANEPPIEEVLPEEDTG